MPLPLIALAFAAGTTYALAKRGAPKNVFFSFHYADIWKVNQVRNSWLTHESARAAGFFDKSIRESAQTHCEDALRELIDQGLEGTDATVVLIGGRTHQREWVQYEIEQSAIRGNRLLGITIHNLRNQRKRTCQEGKNPFDAFVIDEFGTTLGEHVPVHDWIDDGGYTNLREWIRDAPTLSDMT